MVNSNTLIKTILFGALFFLLNSIQAQPTGSEKQQSPRNANYNIDVELNPATKILTAQEEVIWINKSDDIIHEMQFHLYLNAFRNTRSTYMIERGSQHRYINIENKDGWGYIEIDKISLSTGEILTENMQFIQPDDENTEDKTVFRLVLPRPIHPNKSIKLLIDFRAKLPDPPFDRSGCKDEFFFVAQWFPKVGVYIDNKWNCHQYHASSEFFADFGVYNVNITVPKENIVGASGMGTNIKENNDGTATHSYRAEDVIDFVWTTSPEFLEFKDEFQDVDIRLLIQPDHVNQAQRHIDAAKVAIDYFQRWFGDYPYPNVTIVDPRRGADETGGMEYPTLITTRTVYGLPDKIRSVEAVVIHEFGHIYWYNLIASNEFEEAWLDEGITTFCENEIIKDYYGSNGNMIDFMGIKINDLHYVRAVYASFPDADPIVKYTWEFYSNGSYCIQSYKKPTLALMTLQNHIGKETMRKILRTYADRFRFKHPKTEDFVAVANEVSGQDLSWFFDQMLHTNKVLDYSISRIYSRKLKEHRGYDFSFSINESDSLEFIPENDSTTTDSIKKKQDMFYSEVKVRRLGEFTFPVEIEFEFDDGEKIKEEWDGKNLWKKYNFIKPAKLISATVDPDKKIVLDINYINNSRTLKKHTLGINKLAIRILFWTQFLLDQPEFLNSLAGFKIW